MSISDKLKNASKSSQTTLCKLGILLQSSSISLEDRDYLKSVLDVEDTDPNRIPNTQIGRILREEGYDMSNSAVDRHRRKECPCFRWSAK
jgi:hypothetical protein